MQKEELSEEAVKQMFIDMFFWVAENRPDWLEECITRKKADCSSFDSKNSGCKKQEAKSIG